MNRTNEAIVPPTGRIQFSSSVCSPTGPAHEPVIQARSETVAPSEIAGHSRKVNIKFFSMDFSCLTLLVARAS